MKIGIRELVDFCCRSGDLGHDGTPGVKALEGLLVHQRVQRRYGDEAEAEVTLKQVFEIDATEVELGGRADLLFERENPPRIEEIKTVHTHREEAPGDGVHWAQLKCYGACYALIHDIDEVCLCLNRVDLGARRENRQQEIFSRSQLLEFVQATLAAYLSWHRRIESGRELVRREARAMDFPFAQFRGRQRQFAAEVYRAARDGRQLMVEAPTGSGKTVATLFPALKAIGDDHCDQIVYLSAKVSGQQQAVDTLKSLAANTSFVVIQAKARSCPCNYDSDQIDADNRCRRCIGFFDRLGAAREQLLELRQMDVATIQRCATEHQLCPFELSLQMLPWVDVVICDFNYVFDPLVQLAYFGGSERRKLLLIDELHNLVDRARGMYSARLSRHRIREAIKSAADRDIEAALAALQRALDIELRDLPEDEIVATEPPQRLLRACNRFVEKIGLELFANKRVATETLEISREVFRFQCIAELYDRHHRVIGQRPVARRDIRLLCLNAFAYLRKCYPLFQAVCGFSATLSPPAYFRQALGFDEDSASLSLVSDFPAAHLAVRIGDYIDTRYSVRERHIDAICESIAAVWHSRSGNYLVFFSAYHFMHQVWQRFTELYPNIDIRMQQRDVDEAAQREFLAGFFEREAQLVFAIMGGRFAEGIDYRGEALVGAIVVGVGLPQANTEQQLIRDDFETLELDGFDHAFRFPGMIRVAQSAGRVIRSEADRGVVILLDRRFREPGYARLLPPHWQPLICQRPDSLQQSLKLFWQAFEEKDGAH